MRMRALSRYLSMLLLLSLMHFGPTACSSAQQEQGLQGEEYEQGDQEQEQQGQEQEQQQEQEEQEQQQQQEQEEQEQGEYDNENSELENEDLNGNEGQQASEDGDNAGFNNQLQNSDDELQQIIEQENAGNELDANQQDFEQNLQQNGEQFVNDSEQNVDQTFNNEQVVEEEPVQQVSDQGEQFVNSQPVQENTLVNEQVANEPLSAAAPTGNLPEIGTTMSYIVERGDTLGKIATKIYGDIGRWREVMKLSNLADPNRIYPGDVVYYQLDEQSQSFAQAYENTPKSSTTVQPGDTLAKIATNVYGNSSAWMNIWRQNDWINDPTKLTVGKTVYYINPGQIVATLKSLRETAKNTFAYAKKAIEQAAEDSLNITVEFVHNG